MNLQGPNSIAIKLIHLKGDELMTVKTLFLGRIIRFVKGIMISEINQSTVKSISIYIRKCKS